MFDGPSSVIERLVYQQDELTTAFGDLRLSVDHSGTIRGVTLTCHTRASLGQRLWRIRGFEISHTQLSRDSPERGNWAAHLSKPLRPGSSRTI